MEELGMKPPQVTGEHGEEEGNGLPAIKINRNNLPKGS